MDIALRTYPIRDCQNVVTDNDWRWKYDRQQMADQRWTPEKIAPLIPEHKTNHPPGNHHKRVDNRAAMDAIFFVLRTGCQWNALNATGICSSSYAYRRVQEWCDAGVFERFWQNGFLTGEYLDGIDWSWLSMDDYMTKSPLAGTKRQSVIQLTGRKRSKTTRRCCILPVPLLSGIKYFWGRLLK